MANHKMNDKQLRAAMQKVEPILTSRIRKDAKWDYLVRKFKWDLKPTDTGRAPVGFTPLARYCYLRIFGFDSLVTKQLELSQGTKNPQLSVYQALRGFGKRLLRVNPAVHASHWQEISLTSQPVDFDDFEDFVREHDEEYETELATLDSDDDDSDDDSEDV